MDVPNVKRAASMAAAGALASVMLAVPALAARPDAELILPGATGTEGVASGAGSTFYAGDLLTGDVYRGDIQRGTPTKFIDAPAGRFATGMKADVADGLLFVAGGPTGHGYVYNLATGEPVADYSFASGSTFINDVALTREGAWFTDSSRAVLYFVPVTRGMPGTFRTLEVSGPAAEVSTGFNNNGIQATADGRTLLVAHSAQGAVNVVDPRTGTSQTLEGVQVPNVDGILLEGRTLWAVQNADNKITAYQLNGPVTSGTLERTITSKDFFEFPTTVARFGNRLAVANAKFDTGFPPTAKQYEVVVVADR